MAQGELTRVHPTASSDRRLSPAAYRVLVELGRFADAHGTAWPAVATLALNAGVNGRTVRKALAQLAGFGYVRIDGRNGGRGGTSTYYLTLPGKGGPLEGRVSPPETRPIEGRVSEEKGGPLEHERRPKLGPETRPSSGPPNTQEHPEEHPRWDGGSAASTDPPRGWPLVSKAWKDTFGELPPNGARLLTPLLAKYSDEWLAADFVKYRDDGEDLTWKSLEKYVGMVAARFHRSRKGSAFDEYPNAHPSRWVEREPGPGPAAKIREAMEKIAKVPHA